MRTRPKILLADDDPDLLNLYREVLGQLPTKPEIFTAASGARAIAMLEAEPFHLLICDLKMPKLDGLQVLAIVRRKFPQVRTVALTAEVDEQYRSRAYALGVDLFWHKPTTDQETKLFLECIESLLGRESEGGFRGMQSKSLMDIIQLECISQSSSVVRISNGATTGCIWIQNGDPVDAEAADLRGETAFQRILSWKSGNFEMLPADPSRPRTIFKSYNALLLESAQAIDESQGGVTADGMPRPAGTALPELTQFEGLEFVLSTKAGQAGYEVARGLENPERLAAWSRKSLERFRSLGERLGAGPLEQIEGYGPQRHVAVVAQKETEYCIGWMHSLAPEQVRESMKKLVAIWAC